MRKTVVSAVLGVLALGAGFGSFTLAGSAHTPAVNATCESVHVNLANYNTDGDRTNNVEVTIDGAVVTDQEFDTEYVNDYEFVAGLERHTYVVVVTAHDDPSGEKGWTRTFDSFVDECVVTPPPATSTTTAPVTTTTPATTAPATTVTTAPVTTAPVTTTTTAPVTTTTTAPVTTAPAVVVTTTPAPATTPPAPVATTTAATTPRATTTTVAAVVTRVPTTAPGVANLPRTGADGTSMFLGISAGLLLLGSGAVWLTRRRAVSAHLG